MFKNGDDIYFQIRSNGQLFKIDTNTDVVHRLDFDVTEAQKKELIRQACKHRTDIDELIENAGFSLDNFLDMYICNRGKW